MLPEVHDEHDPQRQAGQERGGLHGQLREPLHRREPVDRQAPAEFAPGLDIAWKLREM